jgi:beta-glucosidase
LLEGYEEGTLTEESINIAVSRILTLVLNSHQMKNEQPTNNPDLEAHAQITRQSASEGMILLKNEDVLPITEGQNVALLGSTSYDFIAGGTGSGDVNEAYSISLEAGLEGLGFKINEFAKSVFEQHKEANSDQFIKPEGLQAMFNPYMPPEIEYTEEQLDQIVESADLGIITIGRNAGEGGDRVVEDDFLLSDVEQKMLQLACQKFQTAGKKVIVVLNIGGVIETSSWKSQPDAILLAWQGGQEGGNSVADILSGRVNPSGKLPMTFPVDIDDHWSHANFPLTGEKMSIFDLMGNREEKPDGEKIKDIDYTEYEEGIYVGYRHFDKAELEVSYPFGYGLSYTDFQYADLEIMQDSGRVNINFKVENTGKLAGKEVVQVYVSKIDSKIDRPVQELKTFYKTKLLAPGNQAEINLQLSSTDFMYWSEEKSDWELEPGLYEIRVGASSRDIKLSGEVNIEVQDWIVLPPSVVEVSE